MRNGCLKTGDLVTVSVDEETRERGYNPAYRNGEQATVVGFDEIMYGRLNTLYGRKPGVYTNPSQPVMQLASGVKFSESASRVSLLIKDEGRRREEENVVQCRKNHFWTNAEFLRDLPETLFWEGDHVRVKDGVVAPSKGPYGKDTYIVRRIKYSQDESGVMYDVGDHLISGWNQPAAEKDMTLVRRGLVWDYYRNNHISFPGLREEVLFYRALGLCNDRTNREMGCNSWPARDAFRGLQAGDIHAIFMGDDSQLKGVRFYDEEMGQRIAVKMLESFEFFLL